ncbi:MAG: purine-binding chemotaxis protein CheW [Spirochaetales bacterium]|nr:purine-binding chemotaxis protein CheW [Spirochaetales bacterium]
MSEITSQYLTFRLAQEQYALEVSQVQEVLEMQDITHIPGMPGYMRGVINIRGRVVPVVDLRAKLGLPARENTEEAAIIVAEISEGESHLTLGCLADSVQEVTNMDQAALEPPPKMGTSIQSVWIKAIGKKEDGFVILLDMERIFNFDELAQVYKEEKEA